MPACYQPDDTNEDQSQLSIKEIKPTEYQAEVYRSFAAEGKIRLGLLETLPGAN